MVGGTVGEGDVGSLVLFLPDFAMVGRTVGEGDVTAVGDKVGKGLQISAMTTVCEFPSSLSSVAIAVNLRLPSVHPIGAAISTLMVLLELWGISASDGSKP